MLRSKYDRVWVVLGTKDLSEGGQRRGPVQ